MHEARRRIATARSHETNQQGVTIMPQALLIFDALQNESVLSRVAELASVTQLLPPRLAIVEGDPNRLASIHGIPGIISMFEGPVPETMLRQLNPTERLFAEA